MKWLQTLMEKVSRVFTQKPEETKKNLEFPPFDPDQPEQMEMNDMFLSDEVVIQENPKKKPAKKKKTTKKKKTLEQ